MRKKTGRIRTEPRESPPLTSAGERRRRPGAPIWLCPCPSLTTEFGATAPGVARGSSLGFVPWAAAPVGPSNGGWGCARAPAGTYGRGGAEAKCAPLWCSISGAGSGQLPGLRSMGSGASEPEQRRVDLHVGPAGRCGHIERTVVLEKGAKLN